MNRLIAVMRDARLALAGSAADWDALIRVARRANLLGHLAEALAGRGLLDAVPAAPRAHLQSARMLYARQQWAVRREIGLLRDTLSGIGLPLVLLKGAAYLIDDSIAARGRLFSDIDILVPQAWLDEVESQLMLDGWHMMPLDAYDERYYRQWMHELPPMRHRIRGTALDVHHTILPRTARLCPDAALLFEGLRETREPGVWVLGREDQVLHSACHWFFESEHQNGLRDMMDLAALIGEAQSDAQFWPALLARSRQLQMDAPLFAALGLCAQAPGLDMPPAVAARVQGPAAGSGLRRRLYRQSLRPAHALTARGGSALARGLLYLRGHWLRMPPHRLIRHLLHKALLSHRSAGA